MLVIGSADGFVFFGFVGAGALAAAATAAPQLVQNALDSPSALPQLVQNMIPPDLSA
jgi:hypothetical protein